MPFVRRHVTRRLKAAKAECDKELQRVTNNVTAFFEDRLREGDHEHEADRDHRERERESARGRESKEPGDEQQQLNRDLDEGGLPDSAPAQPQTQPSESYVLQPSELRSALQAEESCSDGGYDGELEAHTRQRASLHGSCPSPPALTHATSSPGLLVASHSPSMSPSSLRRQNTHPSERSSTNASSNASPALSTQPLSAEIRKQGPVTAPTSWATQGISSRRLSRTIHIPTRSARSAQSSRSTSRSRSPLPPMSSHTSFAESFSTTPPIQPPPTNRRSSRILVDDPVDPIMSALYDIIGVATDIMEMSITQLTAQPKVCEQLVQRVQNIGKAWDDHPDWQGRNWYVQVLLAVASLSRVVEWWEAEKQFWNFDDNEDEQDEPLTFVTKPAYDDQDHQSEPVQTPPPSPSLVPSPPQQPTPPTIAASATAASHPHVPGTGYDENRLRLSRPASQGRKSRDEQPKDLSLSAAITAAMSPPSPDPPIRGAISKLMENTESARVLATERLRLQAETAQNQNIVIELSLDGDHFIWINYAWRFVVGFVTFLLLLIVTRLYFDTVGFSYLQF